MKFDGSTATLSSHISDSDRQPADPQARAVVAGVLSQYRGLLISTEVGVIEDRDVEAVHDFRVAIRRTRALLTALPQLFEPIARNRFRDDLAWIARSAGRQRDLDVLIALLDGRSGRPKIGRKALASLRAFVVRRRAAAHRQFLRALASPRYRRFKTDWFHFLDAMRTHPGTGHPVQTVASSALLTTWRELRAHGDAIGARARPDRLHELRKDCKQLRYLIEAFADLFASEQLKQLSRAMRKLQDLLGSYCDTRVQMQLLEDLLKEGAFKEEKRAVKSGLRKWQRRLRENSSRLREKCVRRYASVTRKRQRRVVKEVLSQFAA